MERALYGPGGFYVAGEGAVGHFRTSAAASPAVRTVFAEALAELLQRIDAELRHPEWLDCVDVGGGSGDLLEAVLAAVDPKLGSRLRPCVVERRRRPSGLSARVGWLDAVPELTGLLLANEWLDNVAVDVVVGEAAHRVLVVDTDGTESSGPAPTLEEAAWLGRWWPFGPRREIGLQRDRAWAGAVCQVRRGLAVAIDYVHTVDDRPVYGTLTGFQRGRETVPIPDGRCDLTAHVAIDSVAAAGQDALRTATNFAVRSILTDQRTALRCLGVSGRRPDHVADPRGYAAALQRAGDSAELIDRRGLGGFTWLVQGVGIDPAAILPELSARSLP
ncbi:MAG: SAM-dependent methyltransferase [Actinomycetota bacterium]|nr:SAM-dependent methyltransferase [Actinomycetota bacterium]